MNETNLQASLANDQLHLQGPEAVEYKLDIAGIGARSHAFIIDWHIRLLVALSWFMVAALSFTSWENLGSMLRDEDYKTPSLIILLPTLIIYLLYHPILEILMRGRTPGKRMAGVRIVTTEGLTPSAGALLLRNIFRLLDSLPMAYIFGLATCALTKHKVRIGDLASGLLLVYDHDLNAKQVTKMTGMAVHSKLDPKDQALLLDILARWQQLALHDKIRLAEKFLEHIGEPINASSSNQVNYMTALFHQLEKLTEQPKVY